MATPGWVTFFVAHIRTNSGARFSYGFTEDDLREDFIAYYNEVHADAENPELPEDASLDDAIESIEEFEDVSWEETMIKIPTLTVTVERQEYHVEVQAFLNRRSALNAIAAEEDIDIAHLNDEDAEFKITDAISAPDSFITIEDVEVNE